MRSILEPSLLFSLHLCQTAIHKQFRPRDIAAAVGALLNGWQLSNITILQKGTPFTVFCGGCDYNADGTFGDRPDISGSVRHSGFSKQQFLTGILSKTLFTAPAGFAPGNVGRNTFVGPGYINTDLAFAKKTHIPWFVGQEGAQAEFRAEFFNAFNNVNLNSLDSDISSGGFGQAFGSFPARDIQFGLRIEF